MKKNRLDEMQEQKLLKIEHRGYWLGFWTLLAVIYIQIALGNSDIKSIGGEVLVMLVIALYMIFGCIRNGIWDRKLAPNRKTNTLVSIAAAFAFGLFWFAVSYYRYRSLSGSIATFAVCFILLAAIIMVLLSISAAACKHRADRLEKKADEDEAEDGSIDE